MMGDRKEVEDMAAKAKDQIDSMVNGMISVMVNKSIDREEEIEALNEKIKVRDQHIDALKQESSRLRDFREECERQLREAQDGFGAEHERASLAEAERDQAKRSEAVYREALAESQKKCDEMKAFIDQQAEVKERDHSFISQLLSDSRAEAKEDKERSALVESLKKTIGILEGLLAEANERLARRGSSAGVHADPHKTF